MSVQIAQNVACSSRRTPQSEQCLAARASRKSGWRLEALMPWWVELARLACPGDSAPIAWSSIFLCKQKNRNRDLQGTYITVSGYPREMFSIEWYIYGLSHRYRVKCIVIQVYPWNIHKSTELIQGHQITLQIGTMIY
jgi:hypothetical protein